MRFEFDPHKSASNKTKHGIDFFEAQALWHSRRIEIDAKADAEKRHLVIGTIGERTWSAIVTYRGATVRIISVRKSTPPEIAIHARAPR